MLSQIKDVPQEVLLVILQHHERLNGSGYPLGHKEDKLSIYARLTALADCFDGLTSSRPHRYALSPAVASLNILHEAREFGDFDASEAKAFASMIHELTNR
jgi:HD-GYP domain-containing protein (c-di-GMP phosphodiesterase class II)